MPAYLLRLLQEIVDRQAVPVEVGDTSIEMSDDPLESEGQEGRFDGCQVPADRLVPIDDVLHLQDYALEVTSLEYDATREYLSTNSEVLRFS